MSRSECTFINYLIISEYSYTLDLGGKYLYCCQDLIDKQTNATTEKCIILRIELRKNI